jgi:hypothetical protein
MRYPSIIGILKLKRTDLSDNLVGMPFAQRKKNKEKRNIRGFECMKRNHVYIYAIYVNVLTGGSGLSPIMGAVKLVCSVAILWNVCCGAFFEAHVVLFWHEQTSASAFSLVN